MTINKFKTVKIRDIGKVITGKTPPTSQPELFGDKYPFITPSDIPSFDVRYIDHVERGLSDKGFDKQKGYALPKDTVCYVCIGSTIGKICLTNKVSFTNQQINSIIVNRGKFNPKYVYYLLRAETPKIQTISGGTGAGKAILNKSSFEDIDLNVYPLPIQNKIAAILSAYDDLIENNNRRIKILEEMAQLIYREWFVKFRFPGHEKVRMVDSELGPIPEGWEVKKLGDILELAYGKTLKKKDRREGSIPVYGSSGIIGYHDKYLVKGPGIIVGRKGNVGSVFWSNENFYPIDTVFYVITEMNLPYCYFALKDQNFINNDAAVPGLNRNQAYLNNILVPQQDLLLMFNDHVIPIFRQLQILYKQNTILRRTRDLLLPKLISGKLDVEDMDIAIGGD